ncbi:hypothetical protein V8E52_009762 [Russula decolorans]
MIALALWKVVLVMERVMAPIPRAKSRPITRMESPVPQAPGRRASMAALLARNTGARITVHAGHLTGPPTVGPDPSSDDDHHCSSAAETELIPRSIVSLLVQWTLINLLVMLFCRVVFSARGCRLFST